MTCHAGKGGVKEALRKGGKERRPDREEPKTSEQYGKIRDGAIPKGGGVGVGKARRARKSDNLERKPAQFKCKGENSERKHTQQERIYVGPMKEAPGTKVDK